MLRCVTLFIAELAEIAISSRFVLRLSRVLVRDMSFNLPTAVVDVIRALPVAIVVGPSRISILIQLLLQQQIKLNQLKQRNVIIIIAIRVWLEKMTVTEFS
ncbi:hypothetical protein LWI29_007053 [Acer saccharum]|uniref:Uncharacterized protein n=1 Tax=Acer saccharum TaxID=4024 RepID=A0AA39SP38_ACESA|nr:hypothetical protein LWI29_007053 [Acer saccharum]